MSRTPVLTVALVLMIGASSAYAENPVKPAPRSLQARPASVVLRGPDAVQQLAIESLASDNGSFDATAQTKFSSSAPDIAAVDATGLIEARSDGSAIIRAEHDGRSVEIAVTVKNIQSGRPINFANDVVPIFTKLGCNGGGCHGKSSGQNGFRLSLLGFEPSLDYETLVHEGRGRRLFPAAPENSLLLLKAIAKLPHGGGKRLEPGSLEYRALLRWIEQGTPLGKETDPKLTRIEVYPSQRTLKRGQSQQLVVTAFYSDGSTEDVTRRAQYQSNDSDVAEVAAAGMVSTRELAGQAAVMARYQDQVAVFAAQAPLGVPITKADTFVASNFVDEIAKKQWRALGLMPSESCDDAEFIRRVSPDIIGTLPTAEETRAFVADKDPKKREKLVDRLLERPEYAAYFAIKWADVLKNKREGNQALQHGTFRFHSWIRDNLSRNVPYDRFARAILAANGTPQTAPAVMWYRTLRTPDAFVDDTAQVFLGMRLQCAKCHHHPFEKWSQDDYYGFAAFFARVGRKPALGAARVGRTAEDVIFNARGGSVSHPKTGKTMTPKGLGDKEIALTADDDPRQKLADWLSEPSNPFFARALVNRYWAHFYGRGLVEPIDDMRATNPASNPELLQALADDFVKSGYDLKHLIRVICSSKVYSLSSVPNEYNDRDKQSFARHYPKRMSAEVMLDAIAQVTGAPTAFGGLPTGTRAIDLPDESVASSFLDTFGRPKRDTACECERVTDASLSQSLMLLNSQEVQTKLTAGNGRADQLAKDPRPDSRKVEDLFWAAFGRSPSTAESSTALDHIQRKGDKKKEAYEDILWALINAKEFQFID